MTTYPTVTLTGVSGARYTFTAFPMGTLLTAVGGVYAILRDDGPRWTVLYIGQTGDLRRRFDDHHHDADFLRHGGTHLAAIGIADEARRRAVEADLVGSYTPPINQTAHG